MTGAMQATVPRLAMLDKANCTHHGHMSTTPLDLPGTVHAPRGLVDLGPIAQLRAGRLARRLPQLYLGLVLYGVSLALMVRGALGLAPWDVLHSGFVRHVPMTLGQAVILFSFVVLVLWIPLREMPGIGTISNAVVVGLSADATLAVLSEPDALWARIALMLGGLLLGGVLGIGTVVYALAIGPLTQLMLPWFTVDLE